MLPNNHLGLCRVRVAGSRRENMKEKAELQQQERLWQEIKASREASAKVAEARAEALLKAEQAAAPPPLHTYISAPSATQPPPTLAAHALHSALRVATPSCPPASRAATHCC